MRYKGQGEGSHLPLLPSVILPAPLTILVMKYLYKEEEQERRLPDLPEPCLMVLMKVIIKNITYVNVLIW